MGNYRQAVATDWLCPGKVDKCEEEQVKQGKLQLGNEAVHVEYEKITNREGGKRETIGKLVPKQPLGPKLSKALKDLTGANLVTDDNQVFWVEFTRNLNGQIEFTARALQGHGLTSDHNL